MREEHKGKPATMGGALLAASMTVRDQPVECGDAAALQAAESRAAGSPLRGGVAEAAHAAAKVNAHVTRQGDKIMLGEVLTVGPRPLPWIIRGGDAFTALDSQDAPELTALEKAVTAEDARTVAEAEKRYSPSGEIYGGGVAAIVAAAARTNQERD